MKTVMKTRVGLSEQLCHLCLFNYFSLLLQEVKNLRCQRGKLAKLVCALGVIDWYVAECVSRKKAEE